MERGRGAHAQWQRLKRSTLAAESGQRSKLNVERGKEKEGLKSRGAEEQRGRAAEQQRGT